MRTLLMVLASLVLAQPVLAQEMPIPLKAMGASINARMGLNTWAAFYGSDSDAVVAGDVALRAEK